MGGGGGAEQQVPKAGERGKIKGVGGSRRDLWASMCFFKQFC